VIEVLEGELAMVDVGGAKTKVSLSLVDGVGVGDYVLVHAGFAIETIDEEEARKTIELIEELERLEGTR
jgi:hydrogenase expression/formation protein HypC